MSNAVNPATPNCAGKAHLLMYQRRTAFSQRGINPTQGTAVFGILNIQIFLNLIITYSDKKIKG
jgi:hypothetical protein